MELLAGILLVILTGIYAGSETALYNVNWIRLTTWLKKHISGAHQALAALRKREITLITTLVGTNLCSVFATILIEHYFIREFGAAITPGAILLTTLLLLVQGDYLPKAIAQVIPSFWLRSMAFILNFSRFLFAPLTYLLGLIFPKTSRLSISRQDFLFAIAQRERKPQTANMVARLFNFSAMPVKDVAMPIKQVKSVPIGADKSQILSLLKEFGYSRIPVYEGQKDNIIGLIIAKDLLFVEGGLSDLKGRVRPVERVNENTRAIQVLRKMQRRGEHLVVVENSIGKITGIVTLEDLIEELIGEIRSED
ncbi:MAG: CNNM domain-containing protein [candidate division WOR-3 bacterium]